MPNLELAKEIDNFLSQNFFILTKPDENELIAALVEYTVMSKREVLPKYEMEALSRILYWAVKCNYYPFYKSKLLNIIKQHIAVLSETVPPKIHFMSLIGFEAIQLDYINLWIQENAENNTINIWTDSTTLLAEELSTRIEEVAVRHARNGKYTSKQAFRSELIMWQNKACNSIINTMLHNDPAQDGNKKFCFDQAVIIFLEEEGLAKPGELAEIRQTHTERFNSAIQQLKQTTRHPDNVTFIDFHSLNYLPGYFLYLKELVLRGNPVTALDVSRLLILKDQGGLYLDTDLLPCLNEIIFSRLIATHSSNTAHQYSPEVIMQVVLDELTHRGSMPGRAAVIKNTNRGDYPNPLQIIDESARQYIKNVVISALDSGQSLFSPLGRLAVDPYFACSYSGDNNKAIVAAKGSEFIDQILIYIAQIHKVMRRHNIDGLDPDQPIPREINRKIAEDLQTNKLFPDSRSLFAYREGGPYSADIPNRLAPYRHAYTLLMKEAGVVADNRIQPSLHKTIPPFRRAFFSTEEAYLSRLRERGGRFPCDLFRQNSQYDSQYIIQLQDDEEVSQMARFLYNKNADRTAHYCYQAQTNTLAIVNAAPDFVFHGKTRIIFISHGIFMKAMGGEKIVQLLITRGLLQKDTTGDFQKIDRVSIAACYINEATPANVVMNRPIQDENFIENIYRAFSIEKIPVGSISVREKLVLIDALGRTWTGLIKNPQIPEEQWQVDWTLVKESNRKIIFTQGEDGEIVKTRIGLLKEASARTRLLKTSYNGRFGVDDVFDGYQTKLSGAINVKIARQIVENIKKGPVLMVADIMALIAGMCEEVAPHRIIINANRPDMTALQHILRQTEQYHDYIHWLNELDLWGGTKELKLLMEKLFTQPQTAFLRLKERYLHDNFDLFSLNLSDPASAGIIERDKRDKAPIRSIYLGQVEQHFGETIKESLAYNDDPETSLKKMKTSIDNIEQNLKKLSKGEGNTSLYYHSELTRQSEQATINNSKLKRKYTSPRYLIKAQVYYANTLSAHSYRMVIDHCDALVSANRNLLTQNHLETNKWGCLLSTLTYNKEIQQYEMYYLHQDKMQKIQLTTDNTIFAEMRRYLEQQHERLIKCYQRVNGRLYPNPFFSTTEITSMGINTVFSIIAIQHWLKNGIRVPGNTPLAKTLQAHTYVAMTQVTFNTTSDSIAVLQAALKQTENGAFTRLFQWVGLPVGLGLGLADVVFSTIELCKAENESQRILSITQLTFSSLGLSLFICSIVAGFLGLTLLVSGLFITGIALAVTSYFVQSAIANRLDDLEKAKIIANYFNCMLMGWQQGGFIFQHGILLPNQGVVITQVDLRNPQSVAVVLDPTGQKIKKKGVVDDSASSYINLYPLRQAAQTVSALPLTGNCAYIQTLILPTQPRVKIDPISSTRVNSVEKYTVFNGMHFFSRQNRDFPFEIKKDPYSGLAYCNTPIELKFHYIPTNIDVLLGNHRYHLTAPGIDKTGGVPILITPPEYNQHLHYKLIAPQQGEATVTVVLNKAQANMTIECDNEQVKWIIDAHHVNGIELINVPVMSKAENRLKFICRTLIAPHEYNEEVITTITLKNTVQTNITLRLPQGEIVLNRQQSVFYYLNIAQLNLSHDPNMYYDNKVTQAVQAYLLTQNQHNYHAINRIRLHDFIYPANGRENAKKIEDCFYSLKYARLLYTANHNDTIFNDTCPRSNVELLFYNHTSAWYRGDFSFTFNDGLRWSDRVTYENIFWVSDIATKKLHSVYLPILHLPVIKTDTIRWPPAAASEIIQTQVVDKGIVFEQHYTYFTNEIEKQIQLVYLIDTACFTGHLTLLEVRNLPPNVMQDLINSSNLVALHQFMQQSVSESSAGPQLSSSTHPTIATLRVPQTTTTVSIGDKLIWPLPGDVTNVNGNISANIEGYLLNNTDYLITLSAVITGDHPDHYLWSVIKTESYQLYTLYLQTAQETAKEVRLSDFGLLATNVVSITVAQWGSTINMKNGDDYHLGIDERLRLQSLGAYWRATPQNWLIPLIKDIQVFKEQQKGPFLEKRGQTKAIQIAPILAITGLFRRDGSTLLPTWYDNLGQRLLICQESPRSGTQWHCLGMANDQQGAWLLDHCGDSVDIAYLPAINIDAELTLFDGHCLLITAEIPALQRLPMDRLPSQDHCTGVSLAGNGHLNLITRGGIILDMNRQVEDFIVTLLGVTSTFSDAYYRSPTQINRGEVEKALCSLCANYLCPEIIALPLKEGRYGWYHPESAGLFIPPAEESHVHYLGSCFSEGEQVAYFSVNRSGYLLKIAASYDHDFIENKAGIYQRLGEYLILNADTGGSSDFNTAKTPYYLNIDEVTRLWIRTTEQQKATQHIIYDIESFDYDVIEITHRGRGSLYFRYKDPLESISIIRKGERLLVVIPDKILIIHDIFDPHKNSAYGKLRLMFAQEEITASQLASHCDDYDGPLDGSGLSILQAV